MFCSRRCQDAFHALYGNWRRAVEGQHREDRMLDASDIERAAMRSCLSAFGQAADEIGFTKPLAAYSEAEALRVIDAIVTRYTEAMVEHHEKTRMPPVRGGQGAKAPATDPFAELEELPWEDGEGDA
ncbi:sulfurtransferase [Ralstonia solanacearum]|nr:sulfurtransferase [Ralstonia solanacearum]